MFSEGDREEVEEMLQQQIGLVEVMIDATLKSDLVPKIAELYRAIYMELRHKGFASAEAIELIKYRDLLNVKGKE